MSFHIKIYPIQYKILYRNHIAKYKLQFTHPILLFLSIEIIPKPENVRTNENGATEENGIKWE